MPPFLALITPVGATGPVDPGYNPPGIGSGLPGGPPYPSQGPGFPTHPIVLPPGGAWPSPPQPPLQIWGGPYYPPIPTHPIVLPPQGPPLGTWGGGGQPFPTPPVAGPGRPPWWGMAQDPGYGVPLPPLGTWGGGNVPYPTPPIYFPPEGGAQPPLGTWGGAGEPFPTPPIVIPPDLPPTMPDPDNRPVEWKTAWLPTVGWVVVGLPQGPIPTPSAT
jgi:hypothetical protein